MHTRRFAALLLGAWLAGSSFMIAIAIGNFHAVDRLLESPASPAEQYVKAIGKSPARTFLRYMASEQNRSYFNKWELAQLGIGVALVITLVFATGRNRIIMGVSLALLLIVVVQHWLLAPHLNTAGRAIDFIPPEAPSLERVRFWRFQNAYWWLEAAKGLLAAGLSVRLLVFRSRRRSKLRKDVNAIDNANDGRIDGRAGPPADA